MVFLWKKKASEDDLHPNKPADTPFMQQNLHACNMQVNASNLLPKFLCTGVLLIPLGIVFLTASSKVLQMTVEYTNCNKYSCDDSYKAASNTGKQCCQVLFSLDKVYNGQVYLHYQLENFYQNHRTYARSKDDGQLHGEVKDTLSTLCKSPYKYKEVMVGNSSKKLMKIAPCGAIANSIFNDTFHLAYVQFGLDVSLTSKDITWPKEKSEKFANPSLSNTNSTLKKIYQDFTMPLNWRKPIYELDPYEPENNANLNSDLIVWMRTAPFTKFKKFYRRISHTGPHFGKGLPKGNYRMDIQYNYPVESFGGRKYFVLSTSSWLGCKNPFLGICYISVGTIFLLCGFFFMVLHMKARTSSRSVRPSES